MKNIVFTCILIFYCMVSSCQSLDYPSNQAVPNKNIDHYPTPSLIPARKYWTPRIGDSYQIQLSGYPPDLDVDVDIIELDLFESTEEAIRYLHNKEIKVICYFNAGAWENYRPDADSFPKIVIGEKYVGWPGEKWLDISNYQLFADVILNRLDLAVLKGCDGVDPDNVNGYLQNTGFEITAQNQIIYNMWLSEQAHARNLSIGLKNNSQLSHLLPYFDFAVLEDCYVFDECDVFSPFILSGKPVFQIEYTDQHKYKSNFCAESKTFGYTGLFKHRDLDAFLQLCN